MDADTPVKRFSAIHIASPWRGLNVIPDVAISAGELAAALFMYAINIPTPPTGGGADWQVFFGIIPQAIVNGMPSFGIK